MSQSVSINSLRLELASLRAQLGEREAVIAKALPLVTTNPYDQAALRELLRATAGPDGGVTNG